MRRAAPALAEDTSGAEREYGRSDSSDRRWRRRLVTMGVAWDQALGRPLPTIFPGRAAQAAAYRLLHNPCLRPEDSLQPHREELAERCRLHRTVLRGQDTTTLHGTARREVPRGLGPLGDRGPGLACPEGGRP